MTALVGILNRRAVAIAADSAVTVTTGDNTKIYNTSQKIFKLSDKNPVAVMTYDNASFMGAPWDVIIDMYRQERGDNTFKKVQDYADDFLRYISECDFFVNSQEQKDYTMREMYAVYDKVRMAVKARATEEVEALSEPTDEQLKAIHDVHFEAVHKEMEVLCNDAGKADGLKNMTYEKFSKAIKEDFDYFMNEVIEEKWDDGYKEIWMKTYYNYLTSKFFYNQSGLVFVGYGSKDIYPSLYSVYVSGVFHDCLRWIEDEKTDIQNSNTSCIIPFAQTDVMMTMLKGISPAFQTELMETHKASLEIMKDRVRKKMEEKGLPEETMQELLQVDTDELQKMYEENCDNFMHDNYTKGVTDAVDFFNLEDMANMAESLISITNLQRHFSSSEESVGGPVEVAIITRGGGFRWIKHRQW